MGLSVAEFWDSTPNELQMYFQTDAWRQRQERRRDAWVAWHMAGLMRVKRMPPISTLAPDEPKVVTTEDTARRRREHAEITERLGRGRRR